MNEQAQAPTRGEKVRKVVLVVSLALNVAVAGLAIGAWWKGPPGPRDGRDLGFGFMEEMFRPADRAALRDAVRERAGDLRQTRREMTQDMGRVVAALRADPFDPAALQAALDAQQRHLSDRVRIGTEVIADYLTTLSAEDRADFADRIEARMRRGRD